MIHSRPFHLPLAGLFLSAFLPVSAQEQPPWLGVSLGRDGEGLVEILQVQPGSPAEKAGLRPGDRILACRRIPVPSVEALIERIHKMKPGGKVKFRVLRGRKPFDLLVTLGREPGKAALSTGRISSPPAGRPAAGRRPLPPYLESRKQLDLALQAAREKGGGRPLLLIFTAPWCGPGRVLEENLRRPPLQSVLPRFFRVYRVDVDENPGLADRYKVDGIPHLQVIDAKGRPLGKVAGAADPRRAAALLSRLLPSARRGDAAGGRAPSKAPPKKGRPAGTERGTERENTNEQILRELIRIRKLLEEIRDRLG